MQKANKYICYSFASKDLTLLPRIKYVDPEIKYICFSINTSLSKAQYPWQIIDIPAFFESDLLNIDTTKLKQNELVWVANKGNKDWDVFRITNAGVKIAELEHINSNTELEITFTSAHSFSAGTTTTTADLGGQNHIQSIH